jgi:hypothetical protein
MTDAHLTMLATEAALKETRSALRHAIRQYHDGNGECTVKTPQGAVELIAIVNTDIQQAYKHITKAIATLEAYRE